MVAILCYMLSIRRPHILVYLNTSSLSVNTYITGHFVQVSVTP
jgi:hypothetical protein